MKKIYFVLSILCLLDLCSCSGKKTTTTIATTKDENGMAENDKIKHYEIDLDMENYWKYFENAKVKYDKGHDSYAYDSLKYENIGVLNFAYYENVLFTFSLTFETYNPYAENEEDVSKHYDAGTINVEARADGYCIYNAPSSIDVGDRTINLYGCDAHLELINITGKVIFSA